MGAMKAYAMDLSVKLGFGGELDGQAMVAIQRYERGLWEDDGESPRPGRRPRSVCDPLVETLTDAMPASFRLYPAGSYLRGRATVKDLDCVVEVPRRLNLVSASERLMDAMPTGFNPILKQRSGRIIRGTLAGIQVDLYLCHRDELGSMKLFLTGPMEWNLWCRRTAKRQNLMLSQYGLFRRDGQRVAVCDCSAEEPVLARLGIPWATPEERDLWRH